MNLCKTVEKCVVAHHRCLTPPEDDAQDELVEPPAGPPVIEGKRAANTRHHFAAVHEMYDKGVPGRRTAPPPTCCPLVLGGRRS